jgi:hypothetical protein
MFAKQNKAKQWEMISRTDSNEESYIKSEQKQNKNGY